MPRGFWTRATFDSRTGGAKIVTESIQLRITSSVLLQKSEMLSLSASSWTLGIHPSPFGGGRGGRGERGRRAAMHDPPTETFSSALGGLRSPKIRICMRPVSTFSGLRARADLKSVLYGEKAGAPLMRASAWDAEITVHHPHRSPCWSRSLSLSLSLLPFR